jgi:GDPmannose 4,6-dehydratase
LIDVKTGKILCDIDPQYFRPGEVEFLLGCPDKIKRELGWEPEIKQEALI